MTKSIILGDTHLGVRSDSSVFNSAFDKFYTKFFIPYLLKNNIKTVYQLGDLFDRRKYINFFILDEARRYFFDPLKKNGIKLITLLGNHDLFWKNSLKVNSTSLLLKDYDNITVVDTPMNINGIDMIPWLCEENIKEGMEFMKASTARVCMGHFEIAGFSMYKGQPNVEGVDRKVFDRYDLVMSGHFHHRSRQKNIVYVGTPIEMTWQDYDDPKGFHVFDDTTLDLEFVENPSNMFLKFFYDDKEKEIKDIVNMDMSLYAEKYVKIVIRNKTNPYIFDSFMTKLYEVNPVDISIVEEISGVTEEDEETITEVDDTVTILNKYIDNSKITEVDPSKLKNMMQKLYNEALILENE